MLAPMSDDTSDSSYSQAAERVATLSWELHQKSALRGLLKLWQKFGELEIWPDTGLRHIAPIFPYGVKARVNFDMAFLMRRGYANLAARNDNTPSIIHSAS